MIASTFAAFMLMTSSYLVGIITGRSPGFSPLRNAIDVTCCLTELVREVAAIRHQAAHRWKYRDWKDRRNPVSSCRGDDRVALTQEIDVRQDHHCRGLICSEFCKCPVDIRFTRDRSTQELNRISLCRLVHRFLGHDPVALEVDISVAVHQRDSARARSDGLQQFDHLADRGWLNIGKAGDVAAGMCKRSYEIGSQRVIEWSWFRGGLRQQPDWTP